jgi:23S rRNA (cytosine1962-C5)-methyltransferase
MKPRRYQLRKEAVGVALRHPWIFRDHLSSAASVFRDGAWLRLVDGDNRVIGHGIYEAEGAIAIRIVRRGAAPPDAAWLRGQLTASVARRAELATRTDAIRLVHGESDGIPAVVVDRFADTLVVTSYSAGADALARYAAGALDPTSSIVGPARHVVLRPARLRRAPADPARTLRGSPPEVVSIVENGLSLAVDVAGGQKTGTYLDLRGLRREVAAAPLAGARVLNLFAYTGMLGRAAEAAGAATIVQVDASERALAFARAHHTTPIAATSSTVPTFPAVPTSSAASTSSTSSTTSTDGFALDPQPTALGSSASVAAPSRRTPASYTFVTADVFAWLPDFAAEPFDLVIVDPPTMTTRAAQVPSVLAAYRTLYRAAARQVRAGGSLVAACCTSRIDRAVFHRTVGEALGERFTLQREIPPELDHPVGFPQADYLKIGWWTLTG